jgi:oxygen-independent coproporphyrinogen-3 oxidase
MAAGRTAFPDDDELADAWEATTDLLESAGFRQYEISNYARSRAGEPDRISRHNMKYWLDIAYAGFGLGAHAYHRGERRGNRRDLDGYISDLSSGRDPVAELDGWHPVRRLEEALFMGLRLHAGIDSRRIGARYGVDLQDAYRSVWETAEARGLLKRTGDRIRLTRPGRLRSNSVFEPLLGHLPLE